MVEISPKIVWVTARADGVVTTAGVPLEDLAVDGLMLFGALCNTMLLFHQNRINYNFKERILVVSNLC